MSGQEQESRRQQREERCGQMAKFTRGTELYTNDSGRESTAQAKQTEKTCPGKSWSG